MSTRLPALLPGDWNLPLAEVEHLAERIDGELVRGRGVDHVLLAGCVRLEQVRRDLDPAGSDHHPILVTVTIAGHRIRLLWWNVYVGQHPTAVLEHLRGLIDQHQPDVVALAEVYRCRAALGQLRQFRRLQGRRGEAADLAVLVRRDRVKVRAADRLRMRTWWTGPVNGYAKAPREFPRLQLQLRGTHVRFRMLPVHLPTGGYNGPNGTAVYEAAERVVRWVTR